MIAGKGMTHDVWLPCELRKFKDAVKALTLVAYDPEWPDGQPLFQVGRNFDQASLARLCLGSAYFDVIIQYVLAG